MTRVRSIAAVVAVAILAAGACSPSVTPGPTASSTPASQKPPISSPPGPTATAVVTLPGKAETAWGAIWSGVPPWFPLPVGASPVEVGPDPVSGAFEVPGSSGDARAIAEFYRAALEAASMPLTATVDGPLEDGSFTVDAISGTDGPPCSMQVRSAPLGDMTRLTILYGAGCEYV